MNLALAIELLRVLAKIDHWPLIEAEGGGDYLSWRPPAEHAGSEPWEVAREALDALGEPRS